MKKFQNQMEKCDNFCKATRFNKEKNGIFILKIDSTPMLWVCEKPMHWLRIKNFAAEDIPYSVGYDCVKSTLLGRIFYEYEIDIRQVIHRTVRQIPHKAVLCVPKNRPRCILGWYSIKSTICWAEHCFVNLHRAREVWIFEIDAT